MRMSEPGENSPAIVILAICFVMQVVCGGMITNLIGVANDDLARALGLHKVAVLLLTSSLFYLSLSACSLIVGASAYRFSKRGLLATASLLVSAGFCLLAVATRPWQLAFAFAVLFALGFAIMQIVTSALVVQWFDRRRGAALGFLAMGVSTAGVILAPSYAYIAADFGWRNAVLGLAACALLPLLPVTLIVRERPAGATMGRARAPGVKPTGGMQRGLLAHGPLWAVAISTGTTSLIIMAILASLRRIAMEADISGPGVALLFSTLSLSAITGKILFVFVSHRITQRQIAVFPMAAVIAGCLLLAAAPAFSVIFAAVVALGFAFGIGIPGMSAVLSAHFAGDDFIPAACICMMISTLGLVLGPPGLAAMQAGIGAFAPVFMSLVVILLLLIGPVILLLPARAYCSAASLGPAKVVTAMVP